MDHQPQDAELLGVGQGEGLDIDAGLGEQPARRAQGSGWFSRKTES